MNQILAPDTRLRICAAARKDRRLSPTAYVVLSCLLDRTDIDTETCTLFQAEIAAEIGVNVATVERAVKQLSDSGWLTIERKGLPKRNHYRMHRSIERVLEDLA